jgi:hypothetical protein
MPSLGPTSSNCFPPSPDAPPPCALLTTMLTAFLPRQSLARASHSLRSSPTPLLRPIVYQLPSSYRHASSSPAPPVSSPLPSTPAAPGRYKREAPIERDLPQLQVSLSPSPPLLLLTPSQSRTPLYLSIALASAISWGGFLYYATNAERANSSVVRSLTFQLRNSDAVESFLGSNVRLPPLFGEFRRVDGSVSLSSYERGKTGADERDGRLICWRVRSMFSSVSRGQTVSLTLAHVGRRIADE